MGEMKLVPFFLTSSDKTSLRIHKLTIFLRHAGKAVWKTDESGFVPEDIILNDYLLANDIHSKKITYNKDKTIAWIQVDPTLTDISEFYSWDEALEKGTKPECWRSFYFFKDENNADWWTPKAFQCEADIQDLDNVAKVYEDILSLVT